MSQGLTRRKRTRREKGRKFVSGNWTAKIEFTGGANQERKSGDTSGKMF
jgi:hypothetical protein